MATELRKKILIVDDEKLMRSLLQRNVVLAGYDVIVGSNGTEALKALEETTPDLIVVDLVMPDMNGFELCRRIRNNERTKKTPIIVVSALQGESDVADAKNSGADVFLTKPIKPAEFIDHVKKFLPSPFRTAS